MDKKTQDFWEYDIQSKWRKVEKPLFESPGDLGDFLADQDYLLSPDLVIGDELNFIAIYDHCFKEEYLFHFILDGVAKILYANSLPAMLEVLKGLTKLLNLYFENCKLMDELKDDEECWD